MSVVALPRYETLYGNDPEVVRDRGSSGFTPPTPIKTVFQGVVDPILGFGRIIFNNSKDPESAIGGNVMPAATECALYWCVQTLDTSIQNGALNQSVVGIWSNSSALDTSDVHIYSDAARNGYYVSPMSNLPLVRYLEDAFNLTVKGINMPDVFTPEQLLDLTMYSSDIAQALWHADDLDKLMNNLADRMTDALRNLYSDPPSGADSLGRVYLNQTYVVVTWPWLILPVGLVIASCMVLVAAIISSSRYQTIVWKSSSLAVLFHGLGRDEGGNRHSAYRKQMGVTAEEMKVQLAESADGDLHLVEVHQQFEKASSPHLKRRWTNWLKAGKLKT